MRAPEGEYFVISDRAVGWVADGYINAPPSSLRDPSAYVVAPVSRSLTLVGRHDADPWRVTPSDLNAVTAVLAHEWIAGPTEHVVEAALNARREAMREAV